MQRHWLVSRSCTYVKLSLIKFVGCWRSQTLFRAHDSMLCDCLDALDCLPGPDPQNSSRCMEVVDYRILFPGPAVTQQFTGGLVHVTAQRTAG